MIGEDRLLRGEVTELALSMEYGDQPMELRSSMLGLVQHDGRR